MKANPSTFYEPQNRVLFDETTAEILTGATTYHALSKEQQEQLKEEFSERVLNYFDELNIAPTLDNLLLHQNDLRKEITFQVEEEIELENEAFLGLGKKAKAKRAAKKSGSDNWSTQGNWNQTKNTIGIPSGGANTSTGRPTSWTGAGETNPTLKERAGGNNPRWENILTTIVGGAVPLMGAIQGNKQNNQQDIAQQQQFFPNPEPKKPKVLGLEPVVGIAVIILILAVFGFLIWQISQKQ